MQWPHQRILRPGRVFDEAKFASSCPNLLKMWNLLMLRWDPCRDQQHLAPNSHSFQCFGAHLNIHVLPNRRQSPVSLMILRCDTLSSTFVPGSHDIHSHATTESLSSSLQRGPRTSDEVAVHGGWSKISREAKHGDPKHPCRWGPSGPWASSKHQLWARNGCERYARTST